MSAEYLLKMEVLRRNREELTARRQEIERRIALREATAAEYSAIALQSCKQKWKSLRAAAIAAKNRNDEFIREVHETQRKIDEVYVRTTQKLWPSDNQLELEKARYLRKVEELYPAWQEKMQTVRIQTLRELEEKKRAIEKRRYLAKKTFETEQTLDDLIQQTSHEIGLAENLEKNEAFEREVLRNQSAIQSMRLDESIREHAVGARMYMKQQAFEQLTAAQHVHNDVEEKIFETFSPRGAVKAMRQANNALAFVESVDNNAEDRQQRPHRSQSIAIPATQYRSHATEDPLPDPYVNTRHDASEPVTSARSWARSGFTAGSDGLAQESSKSQTARQSLIRVDSAAQSLNPTTRKTKESGSATAPQNVPQWNETTGPVEASVATSETASSAASSRQNHVPEATRAGEAYISTTSSKREHTPGLVATFHKLPAIAGIAPELGSTILQDQEMVKPGGFPLMKPSSFPRKHETDEEVATLKAGFVAMAATTQNPTPDSVSHRLLTQESPVEIEYGSRDPPHLQDHERHSHESAPDFRPEGTWTPAAAVNDFVTRKPIQDTEEDQQFPAIRPFQTYKFVELQRHEGLQEPIDTIAEEKSSNTFDNESKKMSPSKSDGAPDSYDTRPTDLSLNLINSFESNQSSVIDFSVGKLLQTPVKPSFGSGVSEAVEQQKSPPGIRPASVTPSSVEAMAPSLSTTTRSIETENVFAIPPSRTTSFDKKTSDFVAPAASVPPDNKQSSVTERQHAPPASFESKHNAESSLIFSSLESASGIDSPALKVEDDAMIESVSDFGSPIAVRNSPPTQTDSITVKATPPVNSPPHSPTDSYSPTPDLPSLFTALSMPERFKALTALLARVEDGVSEGELLSGSADNEASRDTKRELLRMAVSGRKAQINFFGTDVCFELVIDLARELGPVLFPAKAFEGILNDQKMKKVHQNGKEKEADIWKVLAAHMKQLHTAKAIPVSSLVDLFTSAFLSHDPSNQRSLRKLRELLFWVCGASESVSTRSVSAASPQQDIEAMESVHPRGSMSTERETPTSPQIPTLLQTAFLQAASPPKTKTYGIASSSFKKKSSTDDVLKSMASSPARLSQKLMRGGKMGDYSEFEEEDEVDLDNLIGSKPSMASSHHASSHAAKAGARSHAGPSTSRFGGAREEDKDDFDVDF